MRALALPLLALALIARAEPASAQVAPEAAPAPAPASTEVDALERTHQDAIQTRRVLADSVLVAGLVSIAAGGALIIPDAEDQAFRYAGINTAIFGAVNTVVGLLALHGIAEEERVWETSEARAARRTPDGLARARAHAVLDERRESVGHAINLGLNCAYLGVAGTAVLASQLGVDHSKRWLASGVAIGVQAVFLVGIDLVGLMRSQDYHRRLVLGVEPTVAVVPTAAGTDTWVGLTGRV
jgi:hypothetical protein